MFTKYALETQIIWHCRNVENGSVTHPASYSTGIRFFPGGKADDGGGGGGGVMLNTHLHLAPRLRMIGGIEILHLYVFTAWAWITSPLYLYLLFGSIILLTVVIVKQGIFWKGKKKDFLTPAANHVNCRVVLLSHIILFPSNYKTDSPPSPKLVHISTLIFTFPKTVA